ncbi:hypothetical protein ES288_A08G038300v1 [Gossypium darwinii]|uniref:Pectate lyase superfamily protein domain-containing protein n=1 Tax=Gossypium darwinii TaxID=34276 RepID=A0A5D2FH82_GOSDA|nr:hypothetical protein ES288_A08G038300v1 [Gossypium darwinii]
MGLKMLFSISFFQWVLFVQSMEPFVYDVNLAGAIGDGESDDTEAFKNAWNVVCSSHISSGIFRVPYGQKFLLQPLTFNGECRPKNITFQIDGILIAPSDPSSWKCKETNCNNWITFQHFDGLIIQGTGSLHGQGQKWWQMGCMHNKVLCSSQKAASFAILDSKNVHISGLTSMDSRKWHISIERSSSVHASKLTYFIGSLGENGRRETVEYVTVRRANFYATENGLKIKTWQGGHGYARYIRFEHISFSKVIRPIIIDQYTCPLHQHCKNYSTAVEISNILYNDLRGTTNGEIAVELSCSKSVPCKNIRMKDIQLDYGINGKMYDGHPKSHCLNVVQSWDEGYVYPNVHCLTKKLSY